MTHPVMDPKKTLTVTRAKENVIEIHGTKVNKVMLLMAIADVVWQTINFPRACRKQKF